MIPPCLSFTKFFSPLRIIITIFIDVLCSGILRRFAFDCVRISAEFRARVERVRGTKFQSIIYNIVFVLYAEKFRLESN